MKDGYTYDHLAKMLLEKAGWPRVPWYVPGADTHPPDPVQEQKGLMDRIEELETTINYLIKQVEKGMKDEKKKFGR